MNLPLERILIGQVMTLSPDTISCNDSLEFAMQMMRFKGIRHLPVVQESTIVGIISERDLKWTLQMKGSAQMKVLDVMHEQPYMVTPDTPLSEVTQNMMLDKIGCALVCSVSHKLSGIFTTIDALNLLTKILNGQRLLEAT